MINVKITMVNGYEYNLRNIATNVKEFYKNAIAPYGMGMSFMPIDRNENIMINTANIVSIREMDEDEVNALNKPINEEPEEIIGLRETDVKVEDLDNKELEVSQ